MFRVILIGGTSHVGKSTLAESLADKLGWPVVSTDSLGRHPGRPWPTVHDHVAEHYLRLSDGAIFEFLRVHHHNLWPRIRDLVERHANRPATGPLILEGSALRPELLAALDTAAAQATWLVASPELVRGRIYRASGFEQAPPAQRRMIEAFVTRSLADNEAIDVAARRLGLARVDVARPEHLEGFVAACLTRWSLVAPLP